ncbi:GIY-YIG nuclease family protein [Oceanicoccus sp. KOV_DT_Chl]|uniref:GIY-YIG nuclease family protein n=1 Tax=Oceanicoccus sp. KOV_DT_Chl TaxID=1904639 RepID=UPI000C7E5924|nr:GIY-YIG nuclease family protein [Oceanicoccus sp. KOV_DT_Chl]
MSSAQWWVYIIETYSGKLYTGITTDIERRFGEHLAVNSRVAKGKKGAKFFRTDPARVVVYREGCIDRSAASSREAAIKKLSRLQKKQLIELSLD